MRRSNRLCSIGECPNKHYAKGHCLKHRYNVLRTGNPIPQLRERHGMCGRPEYNSWYAMKRRCYLKTYARYMDWGGRGIRVCERWRKSFTAFYADMGPKPTPKHSLDRIDNDGNYEPGNCRWATAFEQEANKRAST